MDNNQTSKPCYYDVSHRCFHSSCDYVDLHGNVHCCKHHRNPYGRFLRRKRVS